MLTTATAPRYLTPPPIQVASEMPRGLGARFFRNQFQITDEELREDARITAAQGDTQWDEYLLQTISQDCAFFAREILNGPPEAPYNGHFMLGPHLLEWSELVRKSKRLAVLAPRDHGKTYFFDFAYPIWKAIKLPNGSGFIFSATQDQAVRILGDIKQELETNPKLQYLVPDTSMGGKGKKWSSTAVQLNNGHRIYARGFGTRVRGAHPHWIVVDDALNDETAYSEVVRKKQIEYFYTAVSNMCIPGGQIVVVGCVIPDTWVTTSGGLRRIGDLCPASDPKAQTLWPLTLQVAGRSGFQETSHYWVNGVCPTKRLTLQRGFTLEGSHRHPVLMMPESGIPEWRKLPDIRVGDYVAVRVGLDAWGPDIDLRPFKTRERGNQRYRNSLQLPDTVTAELSYLLGLWTAEGSYETTGRVAIANTEKPIRDFLLSWPLGMRFSVSTHLADQHVLRVSSKEFLELITFLGGKLGRCHQKIIPEKIMRGPKYVVQAFLQGLYDGDGNACATTPNSVTLGTTSEVLADQVQQLLLNFGVLSTRRMRPPQPTQRCPGASLPLWVVVAVASEAKAFGQLVGFKLARKQKICDEFPASIAVDQRAIPHRRALIATMREEKPRIPRNTQAKFRGNIAGLAACATISTERCRDILNWFVRHGAKGSATEAFRATLVEGLAWLPVKQIADRESPTVDFVVPVGHSFVSNGIVSHNTPFHQADLYADLSANEEYLFKRYQALQGAEETPLWPGRYDKERLEAKRREIGTIRFTREFQCCRPGTVIETAQGSLPIEQIRPGMLVLTHTGNWRPVIRTMARQYEGALIRVKGQLHVTPNHPVLTADGWIEAGHLGGTDHVTFPRSQVLGMPISHVSFVEGTTVPYLWTRDRQRVYARGSAKHLISGSVGVSGAKSIPVEAELDADWMYLFGLWLAEGCVGASGGLATFCFGIHELPTLVARAQAIVQEKLGLPVRVRSVPSRGSALVLVCNHLFGDFLKRTFGHTASKKRVPLWMRDLPLDLVWSMVLGYLDGGGHVDTEGTARVSSVSAGLLQDMRFLLARCGIFSTLRLAAEAHTTEILGRKCQRKASWVLSISGGGYTAIQTRIRPSRSYLWGGLRNSLHTEDYSGVVYNFEVAEDHSYVADGVAVHNCEPVADDMSLFPLALFKGAPTEVFTLTLGMAKEIYERLGVTIFMGVDFAMSSSAQADYTVIWVMGVDKWGNRWIIDIQRGKGLPYQTQLSMINELGHKYDPALVFLEANQMQRIFGDELIRTTDLPIKQFVTGAQKNTLDKGVPSLRVLLENGKFRIPRGDKRSIELTNIWIEEMRAFTWVEGALKSVGTHDDTVMGCWICDQAVRAGGFSFDFGEDIGTSGNLDKMLQDENAETNETAVPTPEAEIEGRIREALGMELEAPKSSGNLIDDEMGDPFGDSIDESKQTGGPITKGNLVDDAEMDEAEMRRKLLGGAPSAARIRSYW